MKIIVREITNNGQRTGAIITALLNKFVDAKEKKAIEELLIDYGRTKVFPGKSYSAFSNSEADTVEIVILANINSLPMIEDNIKTY